jgi:hypothetical protein
MKDNLDTRDSVIGGNQQKPILIPSKRYLTLMMASKDAAHVYSKEDNDYIMTEARRLGYISEKICCPYLPWYIATHYLDQYYGINL